MILNENYSELTGRPRTTNCRIWVEILWVSAEAHAISMLGGIFHPLGRSLTEYLYRFFSKYLNITGESSLG